MQEARDMYDVCKQVAISERSIIFNPTLLSTCPCSHVSTLQQVHEYQSNITLFGHKHRCILICLRSKPYKTND